LTSSAQEGRIDYVLLDNYLQHQIALLDRQEKMRGETVVLLPFADRLLGLQDTRRELSPIDPRQVARTLATVTHQVDSLRGLFEAPSGRGGGRRRRCHAGRRHGASTRHARRASRKTVANRAAENLDQIKNVVGSWYRYYDGYDPTFGWWMKDPVSQARRRAHELCASLARASRSDSVRRTRRSHRPRAVVAAEPPAAGAVAVEAATRTTTARSSAIRSASRDSKPTSITR
jgi:hypothetical protein